MKKLVVVAIRSIAISLVTAFAHAAETIDTDGPDFVESSEVVPLGRFQLESDVVFERANRVRGPSASPARRSTPTQLKWGVSKDFELRLEWEGAIREGAQKGFGDLALGFKWHAQDADQAAAQPAVSWIVHANLPSGSTPLRGHGVRPSVRSVLTWELPNQFALGLMPGVIADTHPNGNRFAAGIFGAVLNQRLSEQFRVFVEVSMPQIARQRDGGNFVSADVGAAYLISNDTQIGLRAGMGMNRNTPKQVVVFEFAQRF